MNQNKVLDAVNYLLEYLDEETKFNTPYSETVWIVHADIADLFDGLKNLKKRLERKISNDLCETWIDEYEKEKKKRIAREKLVDEKLNEMMCKSWADPITEEEIYDALARRSKERNANRT